MKLNLITPTRRRGLCAQNVILGLEDRNEFEELSGAFFAELKPVGETARILFEEIVTAAWRLRRIRRIEAECYENFASHTALLDDESLQQKPERLGRDHTRAERTFHLSLKRLNSLKDDPTHNPHKLRAA